MKQIIIIIAAAAMFSLNAPAFADPLEIHVSAEGLDLSSAEGRAALAGRAQRIAYDQCGTASASDRKGRKLVKECRDQVADAVARHAASQRLAEGAR